MGKRDISKTIRYFFGVSNFLKKLGVSPLSCILPVSLGVIAAGLEGIATILLLPISKGIINGNFEFLRESKYFAQVSSAFPRFFDSYAYVLAMFLLSIFLCILAKTTLQYLARVIFARQIREFTDKLRRAVFDRYLAFGKLFFDRANIGHLSNVLLGFTNTIGTGIINLQIFINMLMVLAIYLAIMFRLSWRLMLLSLIIFPVFSYSIKWVIEQIKKSSIIYADHQNTLAEKAYNILTCMPLVKAYDREEAEKREFAYISDKVRSIELALDKNTMLVPSLQEIIIFIPIALLISYIGIFIARARPSEIPALLVFFYTFKKAANLFGVFGNIRVSLAMLKGPIAKIAKVFNDEDKFFVFSGPKGFEGLQANIDISDLDFSYNGERRALSNLHLSIEKGKMTAIVGETGSGKTTLANLLMRFYDCPSCKIRIDGTDIRELNAAFLRKHMALVSQDTLLFNDTIRNNIVYGLEQIPEDEKILEALKKARLYDFVMSLPAGLQTSIGDRGVRLSGGEKQRVAIARALLKNVDILILDEATSSLDSITERLIQEAIDEMIKGKTVIVIAHRLSTIKNADKIAVMRKGSIIEEGSLRELIDKRGEFYKYWEEQKFF